MDYRFLCLLLEKKPLTPAQSLGKALRKLYEEFADEN
jgi:hypothetical protein